MMLYSKHYVLAPFDAVVAVAQQVPHILFLRPATIFNMADAAEQLRKMETALNKIGLGTLAQKFFGEKLDFESSLAASEMELTQLGVVTIRDKVQLRQLCQRRSHSRLPHPILEGIPFQFFDTLRVNQDTQQIWDYL